MYRKIHIPVNRSSLKSIRYSFAVAKEAIDHFNLAIFPEGGIVSENPPKMNPLKDGAFQLAVQKQVPILPVSFVNNFQILPDDNRYLFKRMKCKIVVHEPVIPTNSSGDHEEELKQRVCEVLQNELDKANNLPPGR